MPKYVIERDIDPSELSKLVQVQEDLQAAGRKSVEVARDIPGLVWIRSYISVAEGKIYCEYEAPNPEAIREHALKAGFPANRISEVAMEISPEMFR
jgi:Nickel responsive protein SCO4226-like